MERMKGKRRRILGENVGYYVEKSLTEKKCWVLEVFCGVISVARSCSLYLVFFVGIVEEQKRGGVITRTRRSLVAFSLISFCVYVS